MQLLRDLVLIEQEEIAHEEKRKSGIILLKSDFNLYQWDDDNQKAQDIISKAKQNRGVVKAVGLNCHFVKNGDMIIYKKQSEQKKIEYEGKVCVIVSESDIMVKEEGDKMIPHPDFLLIKITREAREAVFTKKIKRDDGSTVELFIYNASAGQDDQAHNSRFAASGIVVRVGENVEHAQEGDIAILDYLVDNNDAIIVGYDGEDKLVVASPITKYSEKEEWIYGNRHKEEDPKKQSYGVLTCPHDIMVAKVGDYEEFAQVLGLLRGDELISFDPFVFLNHDQVLIKRVSAVGIIYDEDRKIIEREVLAASPESKRKFGIKEGETVVVDDFDIFDIHFEGKKISAVNDVDIICTKAMKLKILAKLVSK